MIMIVGGKKRLEYVESRLLTFPLFFCLLHVVTLCFKRFSRPYRALGVKFMDYHGDVYCFTIQICQGQLLIFKQSCSPAVQLETSNLIFQVSPHAQVFIYPIKSSSRSLKCTFVNDLRPNLVIRGKRMVFTFSIWGFTYIYKQTKTLHLTIKLDKQIYFDNGHFMRTTVMKDFTIVYKTTQSKQIRYKRRLRSGNYGLNPCVVHDKTITARLLCIKQFSLY